MLVIRKEQMDAFVHYMLKQFENRMVVHLRELFPAETKDITENDLRRLIREGIEKAEGYEITETDDVEEYLECMIQYGPQFDSDPQVAWAGDILRNKHLSGTDKTDQIIERRLSDLERAAGDVS